MLSGSLYPGAERTGRPRALRALTAGGWGDGEPAKEGAPAFIVTSDLRAEVRDMAVLFNGEDTKKLKTETAGVRRGDLCSHKVWAGARPLPCGSAVILPKTQ